MSISTVTYIYQINKLRRCVEQCERTLGTRGIAIAARTEARSSIVRMLPDTGDRYLSSPLFAGIEDEMTDEEVALSRSTPGFGMPAA